ncbi:S-adenosyl-L-methionine-dependent methyltransferase [Piptocephalis cylindrospora]|uniref:S-adenosyl-L-methionine-dependent methyltransferase n=1 Tax=Piptocephalis cylindrospora TaxID=1907219 RepID=A0A4P9Y1P6_9FUNG|nr:S-adenosyl-L-methionine-dependent methyltransferase [Piptocephalis cylindrospora]|eukprot:RKP12584.1 S-adenosyl-L-methionine-dependent methyltransferase [Piptocephalis cylindrospora]
MGNHVSKDTSSLMRSQTSSGGYHGRRAGRNWGDSNRRKPWSTLSGPEFNIVHGRRYLATSSGKGHYPLPVDSQEMDRLEEQHYWMLLILKKNYALTMSEYNFRPQTILDVGTGNGIWLLEMANEFPEAQCVGVDFAPTFPTEILPPNCTFFLGNVLERLPFQDNTFEYTHERFLGLGVQRNQWPWVLAELMRVTRPGGWVEVMEMDGALLHPGVCGSKLNEWSATMRTDGENEEEECEEEEEEEVGGDLEGESLGKSAQSLHKAFLRQGFTQVSVHTVEVPLGSVHGRSGEMAARVIQGIFTGTRPFLDSAQWPQGVWDDFWRVWHEELSGSEGESKGPTSVRILMLFGQKPMR